MNARGLNAYNAKEVLTKKARKMYVKLNVCSVNSLERKK